MENFNFTAEINLYVLHGQVFIIPDGFGCNLQRRVHCLAVDCSQGDPPCNHHTPFCSMSCDIESICAVRNLVASWVYCVRILVNLFEGL